MGHNKQFVGHFENTRDGTSADSLEIYGKISVSVLGRSSLAAASIVDAALEVGIFIANFETGVRLASHGNTFTASSSLEVVGG